jgi:hypothetical protein
MEKKSILDWITRGSFFLLIVAVPLFFSFELTTFTLPKVVLSQILVCLLLAAWLLKMTLQGEFTFKPSMLYFPILVFFVFSLFSLLQAMSVPGGMSLLWQVFAYVILYFIVINWFKEEEMEFWVLVMSLVGFLLSYGILQYFGIELLLKGFNYIPNIPFSTLGHRNQVAQYLVLLISLSGAFFFLASSWTKRVVFGISTVIMVYLLYLTKSRGGILGLLLALILPLGIAIYRWLLKHPFFQRKKWLFLICFSLLMFTPVLFFAFPSPLTLKAKPSNPIGYYIHSIDGSKIKANQAIRIELDYRILRGDSKKPGYVGLYGERTISRPIFLHQEREGWNHVRTEEIQFSATPYDDDIKLSWVPGSDDAVLQLKNAVIETTGGVPLIKETFLNWFFSKLGVTEIDKAISTQARLLMYRNTIEMIQDISFWAWIWKFQICLSPISRPRSGLIRIKYTGRPGSQRIPSDLSEVGFIGLLAFLWIWPALGEWFWRSFE